METEENPDVEIDVWTGVDAAGINEIGFIVFFNKPQTDRGVAKEIYFKEVEKWIEFGRRNSRRIFE